jgi:uncharacterized protein involved in response to NO
MYRRSDARGTRGFDLEQASQHSADVAGSGPAVETEQSFHEARGPLWRAEPFRIFFPLGVVFAWMGVSQWLFYGTGLRATYSCEAHGFVQMQAFMMSFAVGFLFTALPRRTRSAPPSALEMLLMAGALSTTAAGALAERWWLAQAGYASVFLILLQFAVRRFLGRGAGRRPPAAFVLIPLAMAQGLAGSALIAAVSLHAMAPWGMAFGKLLVEQGVFLCLVIGIGNLILPLMGGSPPPADLGSSPRESRRAVAYGVAGALVFVSFVLEQSGWARGGVLLRAAVVAAALGLGAGAWHPPGKPGLHRRLVWLSVWMVPAGLLVSALWPDFRIAALHILFIGGFSLMAFGVATHVSLTHLGLEHLSAGRPPAVVALAIAFLLALGARLGADASDTYFEHLSWAAAAWLLGSAVWLAFLAPHFVRPPRG